MIIIESMMELQKNALILLLKCSYFRIIQKDLMIFI